MKKIKYSILIVLIAIIAIIVSEINSMRNKEIQSGYGDYIIYTVIAFMSLAIIASNYSYHNKRKEIGKSILNRSLTKSSLCPITFISIIFMIIVAASISILIAVTCWMIYNYQYNGNYFLGIGLLSLIIVLCVFGIIRVAGGGMSRNPAVPNGVSQNEAALNSSPSPNGGISNSPCVK